MRCATVYATMNTFTQYISMFISSPLKRRVSVLAILLFGVVTTASALEVKVPGLLSHAGGQLAEVAGEGFRWAKGLAEGHKPVPSSGTIEVAFSPGYGGEELVLRATDSAKTDLRVMAYSFTSARVSAAIVRAVKRGVHVYVLVDAKHNLGSGAGPKARAALSALSLAGAQVRVVDAYAIFHDKVQIVDGRTVQTGSYNYSESAAKRNSENVIVHWDNPALAHVFAEHFARNWKLSKPFSLSY